MGVSDLVELEFDEVGRNDVVMAEQVSESFFGDCAFLRVGATVDSLDDTFLLTSPGDPFFEDFDAEEFVDGDACEKPATEVFGVGFDEVLQEVAVVVEEFVGRDGNFFVIRNNTRLILRCGKDSLGWDEFVEQGLATVVSKLPADAGDCGAVEWRINTGADDKRDDSRKSLSGIVGSRAGEVPAPGFDCCATGEDVSTEA